MFDNELWKEKCWARRDFGIPRARSVAAAVVMTTAVVLAALSQLPASRLVQRIDVARVVRERAR